MLQLKCQPASFKAKHTQGARTEQHRDKLQPLSLVLTLICNLTAGETRPAHGPISRSWQTCTSIGRFRALLLAASLDKGSQQ